jgi:Holliday junction resolvase RusA-like endonuclease
MPGILRLAIPNWIPATLNQWDGRHWSVRARLKKADRDLVAWYAREQEIPKATGKRRVSLEIVLGPRGRKSDPDAYWKSVLDALVSCQALLDDSAKWVELGQVTFSRGPRGSAITLEDLP